MTRLGVALIWALALSLLALGGSLTGAHPARGAPPPGADPLLAPWFKSLQRPDVAGGCCDLSDCRAVNARVGKTGWQALLKPADFPVSDETWVDIPETKILRGKDNLAGSAVVCWMPNMGVLCFVEPAGV